MLFNKERLKTLIANILSLCIFSYLRPGSNRHVHNGHRILSPARLPIPPLRHLYLGAENETRTRDPDLGKVVLYQLSYFRKILFQNFAASCHDSAKQTNLILPSLLQEIRFETTVQKYNFFKYRQRFFLNFLSIIQSFDNQ